MITAVIEHPPRPQSALDRAVRRCLLAGRPMGTGFVLALFGFALKVTWGRVQG